MILMYERLKNKNYYRKTLNSQLSQRKLRLPKTFLIIRLANTKSANVVFAEKRVITSIIFHINYEIKTIFLFFQGHYRTICPQRRQQILLNNALQ
jgi:hypothetical protein